MITLDYLNQLRHIANGVNDGDGEGVYVDMLQALIPALPPMVGGVVQEFLRDAGHDPILTLENIHDERPDYGTP